MRNKIEAAADSPSLDSSAYHCTRREENHEKEAIAGDSTEEAHLKAAVHKVYADVVEESQQEAPQIAYRLKRSRLKKTSCFSSSRATLQAVTPALAQSQYLPVWLDSLQAMEVFRSPLCGTNFEPVSYLHIFFLQRKRKKQSHS